MTIREINSSKTTLIALVFAGLAACGENASEASRFAQLRSGDSIGVPAPKPGVESEEETQGVPTSADGMSSENEDSIAPKCRLVPKGHYAYVGEDFLIHLQVSGEVRELRVRGADLDPALRDITIKADRAGSHFVDVEVVNSLGTFKCDVVLFASQKG